jgi:hypothetical protein
MNGLALDNKVGLRILRPDSNNSLDLENDQSWGVASRAS